MRIQIFSKIITLGFLSVALGLFYIQIARGDFYYGLSQRNCIRLIPQEAKRGDILDRQGRVLSDSRLSFDAVALPQELPDKDTAFSALASILKTDKSKLIKAYNAGFYAPFAPVTVKAGLSKEEALILEESSQDLKGFAVRAKPRRRYLYGKFLSHVLGYLREVDSLRLSKLKPYGYKIKDVVGYCGVEGILDRYLRPQEGGMQIEVNNRGRLVRLLGFRPSQAGKDAALTIDLNMQHIAETELSDKNGCIIVMDPNSGEVLALASSPGYDPNIFVENKSEAIAGLGRSRSSPFLNRAISGLYPPASLFKLVTAVAALESGKISPHTVFFCDGKLKVGDREFKCWDAHGRVDLESAILHSCDVYFYNLGILAGPQALSECASRFGLGKTTGIDIGIDRDMGITVEMAGFVPTVSWKRSKRNQGWFKGDTVNFSIGQGDLLVTPIQMVRVISLFANGGYLVRPYIIKEIGGLLRDKYGNSREKVNISPDYLRLVRAALREVVNNPEGTAHILSLPFLTVAGKTGTAQVGAGASHGWFIGFAPYERPKIAFCVFVEHAGSSAVACLMAKEMLEKFLQDKLI